MLKSTCAAGAGFNPAPVVINEQRVVGSRCGPFEAALEMLATPHGGVDVERYISGNASRFVLLAWRGGGSTVQYRTVQVRYYCTTVYNTLEK